MPTCDPDKKPNETNCACPPPPVWVPEAQWECRCGINETGTAANYHVYPSNLGCPPDTFNNGNDCCVCAAPGGVCPTPTPTPPPQTPEQCQATGWYWNFTASNCQQEPWYCEAEPENCDGSGQWSFEECRCTCLTGTCSPVLIDVAGDGFRLTGGAGGVEFDLTGDGVRERLAWTSAGADDAWLALDRDGDGRVGSGKELFGNFTPQPAPPVGEQRNGFLALAEFDKRENGGNGDRVIDSRDAVFARLRLWRDANHDGASQPSELFTLPALDVVRLHLDYKESKRVDGHGNQFRYRAKAEDARGAKAGRWAWDVFLTRAP